MNSFIFLPCPSDFPPKFNLFTFVLISFAKVVNSQHDPNKKHPVMCANDVIENDAEAARMNTHK